MRTALLLLVSLLVALVAAGPAPASPRQVIQDCQDGVLDRRYSRGDLQRARDGLSGDGESYSNCSELIRNALSGTGSGATDGGSGGPRFSPAPPNDPAAIVDEGGIRRNAAGVPVDNTGAEVDPLTFDRERANEVEQIRAGNELDVATASGVRPDDPGASLPTPLVLLLIVCGVAGAAALAGQAVRLGRLRRAG